MASIADIFFKALLDDSQLQVDAKKSGEKAGQTMGQAMSTRLAKNIAKGAFAGIAAGAAIAGKGLIELNSIQADFQAATGASAEEAERAGKAINEMGGRNLQGLREIGETLTLVHTDLGLVGDAAEKTTEKFLKYATATKQGAGAAVKDFDDILDAWNLTADHADEIMDALIASHQKYGGSIEANQKALAAMAPQLTALNAGWQDGVGLLNLFAASGLEASTVTRALNTAVKNLKPGQNLDDLVREISAIEDPTKRAQRAIEIFGSRGGVALANALKPGIGSLSAFEISATDAAGATEKASDAIESTFSNQVALKIKAVGSAIIGVGQTIGPLGSALTGLISLGGALGFDKLASKLSTGLAGTWKKAAASSLVTGTISAVGDKAATLYLKALIAGDALAGALSTAWAATGGRIAAAAGLSGAAAGTAFAAAAAAAIIAAPVAVLLVAFKITNELNEQSGGIKESIDKQIKRPSIEELKATKVAIEKGLADLGGVFDTGIFSNEQRDKLTRDLEQVDAAIAEAAHQAARDARGDWLPVAEQIVAAATPEPGAVALKIKQAFGSDLAATSDYARHISRELGNRAAQSLAQGMQDGRERVKTAWSSFLDILKNAESPAKERARLIGELASKALQQGLHSQDPYVRATAQTTKQQIIDRLQELKANAKNIGKKGIEELAKAMKSKDSDVRRAARDIYRSASKVAPPKSKAFEWGKAIGQGLVNGMNAMAYAVGVAAGNLANTIAAYLQTHSPADLGPLSEDGGPEGWGKQIADFISKGLEDNLPNLSDALGGSLRLPSLGAAVPSLAGFGAAGAALATAGPGGGVTIGDIHLHGVGSDVSPSAARRFGTMVGDAVAQTFREQGARRGIHPGTP